VPLLIAPALPAGSLRRIEQPRVAVDGGLVLRPWSVDDAATVVRAFAEPDIQRWHTRRMDSADEAREWIAGWALRWADETDASWAIARSTTGEAIGQAGLRTVTLFAGEAQVSYWVLPSARGAGVAACAIRAVNGWAYGVLGLRRLFLLHSTANTPSCRVATAAGFRLEGTLREYLPHADGWHDTHLHARLRTDG